MLHIFIEFPHAINLFTFNFGKRQCSSKLKCENHFFSVNGILKRIFYFSKIFQSFGQPIELNPLEEKKSILEDLNSVKLQRYNFLIIYNP